MMRFFGYGLFMLLTFTQILEVSAQTSKDPIIRPGLGHPFLTVNTFHVRNELFYNFNHML